MQAAAKYAQEDTGEADKPLKVCAEAGRKCVRNIHQYPVLSVEWIALVDSLKQLTRLVQLEGRMPANAKVAETMGRDTENQGTLWDQESHENAIRILVEEAKVNLCLRMMNDYKRWQYDAVLRQKTMQEAMQAYEYNEAQLNQKCLQFEESLGLLLEKAFVHVETLQLMDIPLLLEHTALVLATVQQNQGLVGQNMKTQETVALSFFSSLMKHAEALNNSELLAKTRELELVHLAVQVTLVNQELYAKEVIAEVLAGLSALAFNEDFQPSWHDFFIMDTTLGTAADKKSHFLMVEEQLCTPYLQEFPEKKKEIRPLLDFFNLLKRTPFRGQPLQS